MCTNTYTDTQAGWCDAFAVEVADAMLREERDKLAFSFYPGATLLRIPTLSTRARAILRIQISMNPRGRTIKRE